MKDSLEHWRKEFPIVNNTVYLVSHSLGAMPRRAQERLAEYVQTWAQRGVRAWNEGWWEIPREIGNLLGKIIHAPQNSVVMHQNVSVAVSMVLSCFDWAKEKRKKIVSNDLEFPSILYVCEEQTRIGAQHICVKSNKDMPDYDALLKQIDEQTKIVVISLVFFRNAALCDVEKIVQRAHQVGAYVLIDAYQGIGTVPFDVQKTAVDFLVGGSVKWLCGGPGAAYLYVKPGLITQLEPRMTGWAADRAPFEFHLGRVQYADSIARFLHGTPAVPALYAARAGYEIIAEIGVDAIRQKSLRQTECIIQQAEQRGYKLRTPRAANSRGGSITMDVPHGAAIVHVLQDKNILCDYRPESGIRLSPHFYTKDEELLQVMVAIDQILANKTYQPYVGIATMH